MVKHQDIDAITLQLRCALLNKPITPSMKTDEPALQELQEAMEYLSACLRESDLFLRNLCAGRLDAEPPGRHNFIAGNLKELHSILKHLTWQTAQVAEGDYNQHVRFLGEFSDSFNQMVAQLKEREISLSAKSSALTRSMNLLKSILDVQRDWFVVVGAQDKSIVYTNLSARRHFYDPDKGPRRQEYTRLISRLSALEVTEREEFEYDCPGDHNLLLLVSSYPIEWNGQQAYVHSISDVTSERIEKEQLHNLAYRDTLTNLYNRRYCLQKMQTLLEQDIPYSIALLDLDGLKQVNDVSGHLQGDDYILSVAEAVTQFTRADDRLCRIGGDEFVLILPECSEQNAERKLSRVCEYIAQLDKPYPLSLSYGIVCVPGDCTSPLEDLLSLADIKMYTMKQLHKRNR